MTDFPRRRTRTELEPAAELGEWATRLAARFPWLHDDGEEDGEHERSRALIVHAGTTSFFYLGDRWTDDDDGLVELAWTLWRRKRGYERRNLLPN